MIYRYDEYLYTADISCILDALIKRGQMEMAKGAFKTQLEVLEKVHPDQVTYRATFPADRIKATTNALGRISIFQIVRKYVFFLLNI